MAAAGLWTTPSDLALAAIEVQNEYAGTSHKVLSQALAKEMLTHQKENWGLGFELEKPGATPRFDHFGVNDGFVSVVEAYRDNRQGIVIMTNGQQGEKLITEILRAAAHEYAWPDFQPAQHALIKLDPASLKNLGGTYDQADPDGQDKLTITIRNGHPYIAGTRLQLCRQATYHCPTNLGTRRVASRDAAAVLHLANRRHELSLREDRTRDSRTLYCRLRRQSA